MTTLGRDEAELQRLGALWTAREIAQQPAMLLKTQAALAVVWAPSEEAARYSAYLYCARLGYQPTEPASHYSPSPSAGSASLPGLGQAVRGKSTTCAALPPWGPVCQLRGRQRDPLSYSQQGESQREQRGADI